MAVKMNKKAKANEIRKNAEAQKAKKKANRSVKANLAGPNNNTHKGKSLVGQSKKKK